jgi:hypothetical protein
MESALPDIETQRPVALPAELTCSKYSRTISNNHFKLSGRQLLRELIFWLSFRFVKQVQARKGTPAEPLRTERKWIHAV